MLKGIISISGKPGLFRLLSRGKNSLIVESLQTGKRTPTYPYEKVISLADISIYTNDGGDQPLPQVMEKVKALAEGKSIDVKAFANDAAIREYFGKALPEFDEERVYTTDIKKLFSWYNQLIAAGVTEFEEPSQEEPVEAPESEEKAEE